MHFLPFFQDLFRSGDDAAATAKEETSRLQTLVHQQKMDFFKLKHQFNRMQQTLVDKSLEVGKLKLEAASQNAENQQLQFQVHLLRKTILTQALEIKDIKHRALTIHHLQDQLAEARAEIIEKDVICTTLQLQVESYEKKYDQVTQENHELRCELARAREIITKLQEASRAEQAPELTKNELAKDAKLARVKAYYTLNSPVDTNQLNNYSELLGDMRGKFDVVQDSTGAVNAKEILAYLASPEAKCVIANPSLKVNYSQLTTESPGMIHATHGDYEIVQDQDSLTHSASPHHENHLPATRYTGYFITL